MAKLVGIAYYLQSDNLDCFAENLRTLNLSTLTAFNTSDSIDLISEIEWIALEGDAVVFFVISGSKAL